MAGRWKEAPEAKEIASSVILSSHPHLEGVDIRYVFREKATRSKGNLVWGKAILKGGVDAYLRDPIGQREFTDVEPHFIMELAWNVWTDLRTEQREALIDHELCHMGVDENDKLYLIPHDVEDFAAVIRRHGVGWNDSLKHFAGAVMSWEGQVKMTFTDDMGQAAEQIVEDVLMRHLADSNTISRIVTDLRPFLREHALPQDKPLKVVRGGMPRPDIMEGTTVSINGGPAHPFNSAEGHEVLTEFVTHAMTPEAATG